MKHLLSRFTLSALALLLATTTACVAQRTAPPMVMASVPDSRDVVTLSDDASVTTVFRALLDEVIGDSADKVCLSVASANGTDVDPSSGVMHALRGRRATVVLAHSVCFADEQNFGNPHGLLRLRDISRVDEHTLIVHAEAIGDHSARYECLVPAAARARERTRCRITERDWPGSQKRG